MLGMFLVLGMACEDRDEKRANPLLNTEGPCPGHAALKVGQHKDCPILVSQSNILAFNTYANTDLGRTRHYRLVEDVVLSGTNNWEAIGTYRPRAPFMGSFDGDGHSIRNLSIETADSYQGMFGYMDTDAVVEKLALENVNLTGDTYVGGLVGNNHGTVQYSYATGNVNGSSFVGGLVGANSGTVEHSHTADSVITSDTYVGGLVGNNHGTVQYSYATGNINGSWFVGGLVGANSGTVEHSHTAGSVIASGTYVGGLVGYGGYSDSIVANSYSESNVNGGGQNIGGLVGNNSGTVQNSYATGNVSGPSSVGGLVGNNSGTLQNSYATGNVSGTHSVGGLLGHNFEGMVQNSYATGSVTSSDSCVGGLVGYNHSGTVQSSMALGPRVSGTISVGRVAGINFGGTLVNNFAFAGMLNGAGNTQWDNTYANAVSGADRTAEELKTRGGFPSELTSPLWTYEEGSLPGLGHTVPMPDWMANSTP